MIRSLTAGGRFGFRRIAAAGARRHGMNPRTEVTVAQPFQAVGHRRFPAPWTGLESPIKPQAGKPPLPPSRSHRSRPTSVFGMNRCLQILFFGIAVSIIRQARADDHVGQWNAIALEAVRFANMPPPAAARHLAILHLAMFDAINGLSGPYVSYRPHSNPPMVASAEAALAAAANRVLRYGFPQFTVRFDAELQAQLFAIPDRPEETAGVAWGRQVAQDILREREFDGSDVGVDYRPSSGPGRWQPTPPLFASALLPQWAGLTPFTLARPDQFRPAPPPSLSSTEWAEQCNEVKRLGARTSALRTPEQTEIAWFWADGVGTETPPGHWNQVAQQFVEVKGLSLVESARLFALLNLALADASIVAWDAKYAYDW